MLKDRVLAVILSNRLIQKNEIVIVGISGGPDSMALVHLLGRLQRRVPLTLHAAHLNHEIRPRQAKRDAQFVSDYCTTNGIPFTTESINVPHFAKENKLSLEDAARQVRYHFLSQCARSQKAVTIAVGHNANDQVETILMNFLRGAGSAGLSGISVQSPLSVNGQTLQPAMTIIRPLLVVWRNEISDYLNAHHIPTTTDSSNADTEFHRNKLRHKVLPYLRKLNPNLDDVLLRMGDVLAKEDDYMTNRSEKAFKKVKIRGALHSVTLNSHRLKTLPMAIQRRVVRKAIECIQGDLKDISLSFIENFLENGLTTIALDAQNRIQCSKDTG